MANITNTEVVNKFFIVKNLLEKIGNKKIFKIFGLSVGLYAPLKIIESGVSTISEIRKCVNETPASLTQKIAKLESSGLVIRKVNISDKRKWDFKLTDKGKNTLLKAEQQYEKVGDQLFCNFSENEKYIFFNLLSKLEVGVNGCE